MADVFFNIKKVAGKNIAKELASKSDALKKGIRNGFYKAGKMLVAETKGYMSESKSGRTYFISAGRSKFYRTEKDKYAGIKKHLKHGKMHIASAPGEAPAVITGKLRKSVDFAVSGTQSMKFGVLDKYDCEYGKLLEYKNIISMSGQWLKNIKPRPFISRAYKEKHGEVYRMLTIAIDSEIKK